METTLTYDIRLALSFALAALTCASLLLKMRWNQAFGIAFMSIPLWQVFLAIINNWQGLSDPTTSVPAVSPNGLTYWFSTSILSDVGYLGIGFVAWQAHRNGWFPSPRTLAGELRDLGRVFDRDEAKSAYTGAILFPVLLTATIVVSQLLRGSALESGDESSVFRYMTPYHTIFLSLAAGFTEELLYRGLLFVGLLRVLPGRFRFALALMIQAVVFGLAHSGYGTWSHVLMPTLFGLIAGIIAYRYGIWAAIVLHVFVDIVAFAAEGSQNHPVFWNFVVWLVFVNLLASLVAAGFGIRNWYVARVAGAT